MRFGALYLLLRAIGAASTITPAPTLVARPSLEARQTSTGVSTPSGQLLINDVLTECAPIRLSWQWPGSVPPYRVYVMELREGHLAFDRSNITGNNFTIPALAAPAGYQAQIMVGDSTGGGTPLTLKSPMTTVRQCYEGTRCDCTPPVTTTRTGTPSYLSASTSSTVSAASTNSPGLSSTMFSVDPTSSVDPMSGVPKSPASEASSPEAPDETSDPLPPATGSPLITEPTSESAPERKLNLAPIIGGVVGATLTVGAFITILWLTRRKREPSRTRTPARRLSIDEDLSQPPPAPFFSDEAARERHLAQGYYDGYPNPPMAYVHSRPSSAAPLLHSRSNSYHTRTQSTPSTPHTNGGLAGIGRRDVVVGEPRSSHDLLPAAAAVVGLPSLTGYQEPDYTAPPPSALLPPQQRLRQETSQHPTSATRIHTVQSARAAKAHEARRTHAQDAGFVEDGVLPPLYRQEWGMDRLRRIDGQQ